MADTTIGVDARRTDQRNYDRFTPFWITSGPIDGKTCCPDGTAKAALAFSFPDIQGDWVVEDVVLEVLVALAGGTITVDVGRGTLATNIITTGGVVTIVDLDEYIKTTDITSGTAGMYRSLTAHTSDWLTDTAAHQFLTAGGGLLVGADATVPAMYVQLDTDAAGGITSGSVRVHALVRREPNS